MAQSLNTKAQLATKAISYLGFGPTYGQILVGDRAFEFFNDKNVEDFIQIPWENVKQMRAQVVNRKIGRRFIVSTDRGDFTFASKDAGKILKISRDYIGNENVIKQPSMWKRFVETFKAIPNRRKKK